MKPQTESSKKAEAKREQVLLACRKLFLERGFAGTSTDAIAKEAGVSKETLYKHFGNKDSLLSHVLTHMIADVAENSPTGAIANATIESRSDLRAALVRLATTILNTFADGNNLALFRVVLAELPRQPKIGRLFGESVPGRAIASAMEILRKAHESGVAQFDDIELATRLFVGPLNTYVVLGGYLVGDGPIVLPPPEKVEALVDLYLRAIAPD